MMRLIRPVLALAIASCFSPTYPAGAACGPNGECPPGQRCGVDDRCRPTGDADAAAPCVPTGAEICNGVDDDCNGTIDDIPATACDSDDPGDCLDDVIVCDGATTTCVDQPEGEEQCDGADNDCDGMFDELWPELGSPCDGPDADSCSDDGDVMICADATSTTCSTGADEVEACNASDDDCDGAIDEDFDLGADPSNCGSCGVACAVPAGTSSNECQGGVCAPVCDTAVAGDCDGDPTNGCELVRNTDPICPDNVDDLGPVPDESSGMSLVRASEDERWFKFRVPDDGSLNALTAELRLESPPDVDFDLRVRCAACDDARIRTSELGAGQIDSVTIGRTDTAADDSFDVYVEVTLSYTAACGSWVLTIVGGGNTSDVTCD